MTRCMTAALCGLLVAASATANNLAITNVTVKGRTISTAYVKFDIAWENSWRHGIAGDPLYLHDAAWVFFKVRAEGQSEWQHVVLEGTGVNPTDYGVGTGTPVELVVPDDRVGMFVRRSQDGAGTTSVQQVMAVWNFATNNLNQRQKVEMQAFGLEMCYVAKGAFKVGDGTGNTIQGHFEDGNSGNPFAITNAQAITLGGGATGSLGNHNASGMNIVDDFNNATSKTLPAAFPNGFNAFYCMKYSITQGQYTDFLGTLIRTQQTLRCSTTTVGRYMCNDDNATTPQYRNTVKLTADPGNPQPRTYKTTTPDRACNWVSWGDLIAFADWSGLRPMTELEFEKACRGPLNPVADEYSWGSTNIQAQTGHTGAADGSGMERATPSNANCCFSSGIDGPVRVGIYAGAGANRGQAGASYWGIMELSGNVWERCITVGHATGRAFTGLHGNGELTSGGNGNVTGWPAANAQGCGFRGGFWSVANIYERVSDRRSASNVLDYRGNGYGGRAVRTVP